MSRRSASVELAVEQTEQLERWIRAGATPQQVVLRAKIVRQASAGSSDKQIAAELKVHPRTVALWRRRVRDEGIGGIWQVAAGRGRKPSFGATTVSGWIERTLQTKPAGATHWSTRSLGQKVGVSKNTIHRAWQDHQLKPHLTKSFKLSRDPQFVEKLTDVVGVYLGEREVAERLEPLLTRGYRIFHDVPAQGGTKSFNLDHVAVGPNGVALVETKTLRKGQALPGRPDHMVTYDGAKLIWPWGSENRYGLDQAVHEAEWLEKFIQQRTGLSVSVKPILALPGWWVELKGRGPVTVVNSKNVAIAVEGFGPRSLSDEHIELIARQLDVVCRDVEG